jgi:DNA-binding Lrp family transcriptional regulator
MDLLDKKDKKILYQLILNSRQSFNKISKKTGLRKNTIRYRINKLIENDTIIGFQTLINYFKLGYYAIRIYFNFQFVNPKIKKEIINHFIKYKMATMVYSIEGSFDLSVYILTLDIHEIYAFWQETRLKFGIYFSNQVISIYLGEYYYPCSFLINENKKRDRYIIREKGLKISIDKIDLKILNEILLNPRILIVDIAKRLNLTSITIAKRLRRLEKTGLILGYRAIFNPNNLGYTFYKIDIFLKNYSFRPNIIKYIEKNPNLTSIHRTLGYADLELEAYFKNINDLHGFIEDLMIKFPEAISTHKNFNIIKEYKRLNLPSK